MGAFRRRFSRAQCAAIVAISAAAAAGAGCASMHERSGPKPVSAAAPVPDSLDGYVNKTRAIASKMRPASRFGGQSLETTDPGLSAALLLLAASPTAEHHKQVALEYRRLRVLDLAHRHLRSAAKLDPSDAEAFDGLARIWRDWGFPHQGLGDAYRAVHLAPAWPVAANTLGTLLEAVGQTKAARIWYQKALSLDPDAAYALNNICYASLMLKDAEALGACRRAVDAAPESRRAHNNLALALAASGDFESARQEFAKAAGAMAANYNTGIMYMAARQYRKAASAFDEAYRLDAGAANDAAERSRQARQSAILEDESVAQH